MFGVFFVFYVVLITSVVGFSVETIPNASTEVDAETGLEKPVVCEYPSEDSDHLLIEYRFKVNGVGLESNFVPPKPLFYLHLTSEEISSTLNTIVAGMCANSSRIAKFNLDNEDMSIYPIDGPPGVKTGSESEVEFEVKLHFLTKSYDYAIFPLLEENKVGRILDYIEHLEGPKHTHRGINAVDHHGQSSLMVATMNNQLTVVAVLLNTRRPRVDIDMAKPSGYTALFYSINLKSTDVILALLRRGADPNKQLTLPGSIGNTALHFACLFEKPRFAELLLDFGANPYLKNEYGMMAHELIPAATSASVKMEFKSIFQKATAKLSSQLGEL